jgi:hypothetical protein
MAKREPSVPVSPLAGELGVAIADAMVARDHLVLGEDAGELTPEGRRALAGLGMGLDAGGRGAFCRPCLDWTERRPHVAGALGAAVATRARAAGWVRRRDDSRALHVTEAGRDALATELGLTFDG